MMGSSSMEQKNNFLELVSKFIQFHKADRFYQPVLFIPGAVEIKGKWHNATIQLADSILDNISGFSVLDVGCNIGFFLFESIKNGASKCTGIDPDPYVISIAKEINTIFNYNINFQQKMAQDVKEEHDIILLLNVLHVIENPVDLLKKLFDLSKKKLIVEIDKKQLDLLDPYQKYLTISDSPRAFSWRKLAILQK